MSPSCPHCGTAHPRDMCADTRPWTREEKDEWRRLTRQHRPYIQLVSAQLDLRGFQR